MRRRCLTQLLTAVRGIERIKLDVEAVSVNSTNIYKLAEVIKNKDPDVIFNALHGGIGEDGTIQGLFETLKIHIHTLEFIFSNGNG
ncbi:MAG: hypothetical protein CM15mP98_09440 [Paracoccaceae bacterium]|nr:MAG: hypothetical protein CM15mP98_09440 [Paracoccaceae bacterium]